MLLKKLNIILLFFVVVNAYGLSNLEINNAIKEYLIQNGVSQNFSISKKLRLPSCKKNIEVKKNMKLIKHLQ